MKINILPSNVFNRIAAGEVVDRPASALKEIVENSIDAGAGEITIEIEGGGRRRISVTDNGCGIDPSDIKAAFLPHATSKIQGVKDLESIVTLGFRGEALASIASVSRVTLTSRTAEFESGIKITVNGGEFGEVLEAAAPVGTQIVVSDLFYNTPARAKFLRKDKSEESDITHIVEKFMLAHPEIKFRYIIDEKEKYNTGSCKLSDIIYTIYGKEVCEGILPVEVKSGELCLSGFVTLPRLSRSNRNYQHLFVNNRAVENNVISTAVSRAYESFLMKGKFPVFVLKITIPPGSVDVNVHPSKKEVKFEDNQAIFSFVNACVLEVLSEANHVGDVPLSEMVFSEEKIGKPVAPPTEKLKEDEGSSFADKLAFVKKVSEKAENLPDIMKSKFPDFDSITNKKDDDDLPTSNGLIFFDQTHKSFLREVKLKAEERKSETAEAYVMNEVISESVKIIGVMFNTYIIVQKGEEVFFVDQHAAHERQRYDALKKEIDANNITKQDLLVPYVLTLNAADYDKFDGALKNLREIGFDISEFGGNSFKVSSVPGILSNINLRVFFDGVLAELGGFNKKAGEVLKDSLAQIACKGAVKGGDSLTLPQIEYIIAKLKDGLLLCPHGRPIVVSFKRKDLEKWFKRIV